MKEEVTQAMDLRLMIVGWSGIGKSTFVLRFIQDMFYEEYDPTLEDVFCKLVPINAEQRNLQIFDSNCYQEQRSGWMSPQYMRNSDGFICAFSITDPSSLPELQKLIESIKREKDIDDICLIVVGNKCDLECERKVSTEEGKNFADKNNAPFFETSAKFNININEAVFFLAQEVCRREVEFANEETNQKKKCVVC